VPRAGASRLAALVILALPFVSPRAAAAETHCRAIDGGTPELTAIDAEVRLAWLNQHLRSGAARARIWAWTWRGAYSVVTAVEAGLAVTQTKTSDKAADIIGASSSAIGVLANFLLPLKVIGDANWWARHYERERARGTDVCSLLNTAELLFIRDAQSEEFGVGPLTHIGTFAINIAGGLILGLGYNRWAPFAYSSLVGIGVGEIQIATQPTDVVEDLRLYRRGELAARPSPPRLGVAFAPLVVPEGGAGASILLRW